MQNWKALPSYEGLYEISINGEIKSLERIVTDTFFGKQRIRVLREIIMKNGKSSKGYPQTHLRKNLETKTWEIHRLVAKACIPNPNNLPQINHIDGNPMNNHVSNLEWCTQSHNQLHANATGLRTSQKGEANTQSKLTELQVIEIRRLNSSGISMRELGRRFGVSYPVIRNIVLRKKWNHI